MASGVNKASACEQTGTSIRRSCDFWLARDNGAIEGLHQVIIESGRVRLADITNAYAIILKNFLQQGVQPGVDPLVSSKVPWFLG